ncbi:hypothetical protein [Streptomyces sp. NPDC015125]|uniref:hypothetical protein n=1 Tax=Streptomyces sp. NPDC015125 TaxID=3364938 RepID=UPI00370286AF
MTHAGDDPELAAHTGVRIIRAAADPEGLHEVETALRATFAELGFNASHCASIRLTDHELRPGTLLSMPLSLAIAARLGAQTEDLVPHEEECGEHIASLLDHAFEQATGHALNAGYLADCGRGHDAAVYLGKLPAGAVRRLIEVLRAPEAEK